MTGRHDGTPFLGLGLGSGWHRRSHPLGSRLRHCGLRIASPRPRPRNRPQLRRPIRFPRRRRSRSVGTQVHAPSQSPRSADSVHLHHRPSATADSDRLTPHGDATPEWESLVSCQHSDPTLAAQTRSPLGRSHWPLTVRILLGAVAQPTAPIQTALGSSEPPTCVWVSGRCGFGVLW